MRERLQSLVSKYQETKNVSLEPLCENIASVLERYAEEGLSIASFDLSDTNRVYGYVLDIPDDATSLAAISKYFEDITVVISDYTITFDWI